MNWIKVMIVGAAVASACLGAAQATKADAEKDAAYQQIKKIVGGRWTTTVGKMEVSATWKLSPDGTILGETVLAPGTKDELHMNARFGWDPGTKQPYYLDCHGLDTIYFGHVSLDGDDTILTFKGMVGQGPDNGTYKFRIHWTGADSYHATLSYLAKGKDPMVVENFDWSRKA